MPSQVPSAKPRRFDGTNSSCARSRSPWLDRSSLRLVPSLSATLQPHSATRIAIVHTDGSDLRHGTHEAPPQNVQPRMKPSLMLASPPPPTRQSLTSCFAAPLELKPTSILNNGSDVFGVFASR